jgi:hypothetical protein
MVCSGTTLLFYLFTKYRCQRIKKMAVFSVVAPCRPIEVYRRFRGICAWRQLNIAPRRWRAIQEATPTSAPRRRPRAETQPRISTCIHVEIRLTNRLLWRQWQATRFPSLKDMPVVSRSQWAVGWTSGRTNSGPIRWNHWQWRPVAMEDDKNGVVTSPSFNPLARDWRSSLRLRESGTAGQQRWDSVSAGRRPIGPDNCWDI